MSTTKKRKFCTACGRKAIIDKLVIVNGKHYHTSCASTLTALGSCPESVQGFQSFDTLTAQLLAFNYSSNFWIEIRLSCPHTFIIYFMAKYPRYKIDKTAVMSIVQKS